MHTHLLSVPGAIVGSVCAGHALLHSTLTDVHQAPGGDYLPDHHLFPRQQIRLDSHKIARNINPPHLFARLLTPVQVFFVWWVQRSYVSRRCFMLSKRHRVMNVLHAILVADCVYTASVTHHGNPAALATLTWYVSLAFCNVNVLLDSILPGAQWSAHPFLAVTSIPNTHVLPGDHHRKRRLLLISRSVQV